MQINEYQEKVKRTMNFWGTPAEIVCNMCLGITGEAGEVVDYIKKIVFHGHKFSKDKLIEELGDVLWYFTMLTSICDIQIDEIMRKNIEKLRKRYPNGFTCEDSINREKNDAN
jgi:NTP pyrophosphatase (non-canonical NTP hydrolase)